MMDPDHVYLDVPKSQITGILVLAVFLTCFGSSLLYGYNMAVLNLPAEHVKCFLNRTILFVPCRSEYNGTVLTKNETIVLKEKLQSIDADFLYAQTSTVFIVGGVIGAFSSGWIAEFIGRRNGLLFNHVFVIIGGIINGLTVLTNVPALLFVGRFFIGINSGITIGMASMYLTEISPRNFRGAIGACHQLAVTIGIVLGYIITMTHTLNAATLWPIACAATVVPAIVSISVLPFCPESPRFLFLKKKNEPLARKEFQRLNLSENVDVVFGELRQEIDVAKGQEKFKFGQLFAQKAFRMPLAIACMLQVMQQLSGINAVISYSSSMLTTAGVPTEYGQYCVIGIGVLNVICTVISLPLIEKYGRRTLILWPSVILAASLLLLTITVNLVNSSDILSQSSKKIVGGISVFFIMTYIIGFAFGLGPIPAMIVSELFRQEPRAAAYSISQAIQWISNLIVLFSYPNMNKAIGGYSFLPFLVIVIICWIFFFLFMPETKNRTFDEIAYDLAFGTIVVKKKTRQLNQPEIYSKNASEAAEVPLMKSRGGNEGGQSTSKPR